ncbi:putative Glycosyl transferase group 1 [Methylotuvimicrobium alcaliphilum 20Z]|uniref:Glycosyl transferase group 1 n=2 Tax=Methylotuvimicrobium alcaliphilum TaxID=271065 RepID=G4SYV9_META2|nr:putative Glycosyl transferase group 1 [Methylotuvimicrobium alcaliphilum 20Z]
MAGPMPPAIGGMATVLQDLQNSSLSKLFELEFFNTYKTTPQDRSLFVAIKSKLSLWKKWCVLLNNRDKSIAHIHTCSGFTFFLDGVLVCLSKMLSVPVVIHIHGARFDQFLKNLNPFLLMIVRWIFARCSKIIVLSEYWESTLKKIIGNYQFRIVQNGVPIYSQLPERLDHTGKVDILFLGNLCQRKGVFDLVSAMEYVDGAVLNLVGGEEDVGVIQKISEQINASNLEDKISFHGPQYGEEKNRFIVKADIFVLPSYAEGLPISLLEAMAMGLPVIVTPVGSIPSVVRNNHEGIFVEAGDIEGIANAINKLVKDEALRLRMGSLARSRCEEQFGIEKTVAKLLSIYSEIY